VIREYGKPSVQNLIAANDANERLDVDGHLTDAEYKDGESLAQQALREERRPCETA